MNTTTTERDRVYQKALQQLQQEQGRRLARTIERALAANVATLEADLERSGLRLLLADPVGPIQ